MLYHKKKLSFDQYNLSLSQKEAKIGGKDRNLILKYIIIIDFFRVKLKSRIVEFFLNMLFPFLS